MQSTGGATCKPFSAHSGGGQEGVGRSASSSAPGARVHGRSVGRSGSVGGRADRVGRSVVPGREPESKHGRSVEGFRSVVGTFFILAQCDYCGAGRRIAMCGKFFFSCSKTYMSGEYFCVFCKIYRTPTSFLSSTFSKCNVWGPLANNFILPDNKPPYRRQRDFK